MNKHQNLTFTKCIILKNHRSFEIRYKISLVSVTVKILLFGRNHDFSIDSYFRTIFMMTSVNIHENCDEIMNF